MELYDTVVVTVDKSKYKKEGVHKWMSGVIVDGGRKLWQDNWLVEFPLDSEIGKTGYPLLAIQEKDMQVVVPMNLVGEKNFHAGKRVVLTREVENLVAQDLHTGTYGTVLAKGDGNMWLVQFEPNEWLKESLTVEVDEKYLYQAE